MTSFDGGSACISLFRSVTFPYFSILAGIACIALSFVDPHGCPLQGPARDEVQRREICTSPFHPQLFDELTTVSKVSSINGSSAPGNHTSRASLPLAASLGDSLRFLHLLEVFAETGCLLWVD